MSIQIRPAFETIALISLSGSIVKILIAYYSRTNNTDRIAQSIAADCNADVLRIKDASSRSGAMGYFLSGRDAMFQRAGLIQKIDKDPAPYDLVILGTPVWAFSLSPPMRTFISEHKTKFNRVAFFCTEGGSGGQRVFTQMAQLIGKQPVATLEVTENELKSGAELDKVKAFTESLGVRSVL